MSVPRHRKAVWLGALGQLAVRDAPEALPFLEQLMAEPVEGRGAVAFQGFEDGVVVGDRQRRLDRDPALDRVADPRGRRGLALCVEDLREKASDGSSEADTCDAHTPTLSNRVEVSALHARVDSSRTTPRTSNVLPGPHFRGAFVWTLGQVRRE